MQEPRDTFSKARALKEVSKVLQAKKEPASAKPKRINEMTWPDHWTRAQKRRCVAAAKRAAKKGHAPESVGFARIMAAAGFKK